MHHPNVHFNGWQQQLHSDLYKKTDAVQLNNNNAAEEAQRLMRSFNQKQRNPYAYFNIKTGEPVKNTANERPRRDTRKDSVDHRSDLHLDIHHSDIPHADIHSDGHSDIHPTTATFKDKRIAGVSCTS